MVVTDLTGASPRGCLAPDLRHRFARCLPTCERSTVFIDCVMSTSFTSRMPVASRREEKLVFPFLCTSSCDIVEIRSITLAVSNVVMLFTGALNEMLSQSALSVSFTTCCNTAAPPCMRGSGALVEVTLRRHTSSPTPINQ